MQGLTFLVLPAATRKRLNKRIYQKPFFGNCCWHICKNPIFEDQKHKQEAVMDVSGKLPDWEEIDNFGNKIS